MGRYTTVEPVIPVASPLGTRRDANLRIMFGSSPIYDEYTATAVTNAGISAFNGGGGPGDNILGLGVVEGVINDGGHTFGSFNLNYQNSPDFADVPVGAGDLPASAWVPNPTSPGEGNGIDPLSKPEFPSENLPTAGVEFGNGLGSITNPSTTTTNISNQKMGYYIIGRSYLGSDGSV